MPGTIRYDTIQYDEEDLMCTRKLTENCQFNLVHAGTIVFYFRQWLPQLCLITIITDGPSIMPPSCTVLGFVLCHNLIQNMYF